MSPSPNPSPSPDDDHGDNKHDRHRYHRSRRHRHHRRHHGDEDEDYGDEDVNGERAGRSHGKHSSSGQSRRSHSHGRHRGRREESDVDEDDNAHRRKQKRRHHSQSETNSDRNCRKRFRKRGHSDSDADDDGASSTGSCDGAFSFLRQVIQESRIPVHREMSPPESSAMMTATLPCFDKKRDFKADELIDLFFATAAVNDDIACKVKRITASEIVLKPECTLTRYRRSLYRIPFPQNAIRVYGASDSLACRVGDIVKARIVDVNATARTLALSVENFGIPLKAEELPAYYRNLPEMDPEKVPNLREVLGLEEPMTTGASLLPELVGVDLANPRKSPTTLRRKLSNAQAAKLVEQAAAMVKANNSAEAIGVFSQALALNESFVPALTGRAAALANERRFREAIDDLRRATAIDSDDQTATDYLATILMVVGQEKEAGNELDAAEALYTEAQGLANDDRAQILLSNLQKKRLILAEDSKSETPKKTEEQLAEEKKKEMERRENSRKLRKMQNFIESLKKM